MRRRRQRDAQLPDWISRPVVSDYLTRDAVLADELWRYTAFVRHARKLEEWAEARGIDRHALPLVFPQLDYDVEVPGRTVLEIREP